MCPQIACMRGCKITLVAFVRLFATVGFQMLSQIACIRGYIVTLVAFVRPFSTVRFQMIPQIACIRGCKVTLVAFVWLFLQDFLIPQTKDIIWTSLFHCVVFFPNGCFKLIQINDRLWVKNHNLLLLSTNIKKKTQEVPRRMS